MRALRTSAFPMPGGPPLTMVVVEDSLKVSIEEAASGHRTLQPGVFVITDIFDVQDPTGDPDQDTILATTQAMRNMDAETEANMSVLYYYDAGALRVAREAVFSTKPAPLTVEQITTVFEQLAYHPDYNGQVVKTFTEDGTIVSLSNGHVTHMPPDSQVHR